MFLIFLKFSAEYLKQLPSSEPLHKKKVSNPPACSDHGLHVLKPRSFSSNRAPKIREGHQLFFGLRLESEELQHSAIQTNIEQHFGGFFHQIKVCQPIRRKDSVQTVIRISRRLDLFLNEAAQNFELFPNIQDQN
jgi:hypothetical protein